ncbi:hypothetical protein D3C81_1107190 [compost metagenome]
MSKEGSTVVTDVGGVLIRSKSLVHEPNPAKEISPTMNVFLNSFFFMIKGLQTNSEINTECAHHWK